MTTELNPGKYTSQNGKFYFSCDTGTSVLIGEKKENSTCPFLGIERIPVTMDQIISLQENGSLLRGEFDGPGIYYLPCHIWCDIMKDHNERDSGEEFVTFIVYDSDCSVMRLHMAFE